MLQWSSFLMICSSRFCKHMRVDRKPSKPTEQENNFEWLKNPTYNIWCKKDDRICLEITTLQPYLEPLILQNFFDGHHLLAVNESSLVHHTKRPITNHLQGFYRSKTSSSGEQKIFIKGPKSYSFFQRMHNLSSLVSVHLQ